MTRSDLTLIKSVSCEIFEAFPIIGLVIKFLISKMAEKSRAYCIHKPIKVGLQFHLLLAVKITAK